MLGLKGSSGDSLLDHEDVVSLGNQSAYALNDDASSRVIHLSNEAFIATVASGCSRGSREATLGPLDGMFISVSSTWHKFEGRAKVLIDILSEREGEIKGPKRIQDSL